MTISAVETYHQLVKQLYRSNLHFYSSETPFSAHILIRKRFLKGKTGPDPDFLTEATSESIVFCETREIENMQKKIDNSSAIIEKLEVRLAEAEAQALRAFEEKKADICTSKRALKKSEDEIVNMRKALESKKKELDEKDKVIKN